MPSAAVRDAAPWRSRLQGLSALRTGDLVGAAILSAAVVLAFVGRDVAPFDPAGLVAMPEQPPSAIHWLGTDHLGRDVLSRILAGTRYTIELAVGATSVALILGIVLGALAGYLGGVVDMIISRSVEVVLVIPRLFLVLLLVAFLGQSVWGVLLVIGFTMWPVNARLMRAQVLTVRERTFVAASEVAGSPKLKILVNHVVPNSIAPVIANSSLQMAAVVLLEAGLSFLGLGDPSQISWGRMIQEGQAGFQVAWWPVIFPGVAMVLVLLSLHLIGDALSRYLDPRGSGRPDR